MRRRSQI